ncbi:MAG: polysaccharide biosynthesis tyrosine autokinase [Bacteroidetes bacterium]|nr:polysaccharide biosynthesis tyrosine autokinase [Bacteroidota bacterium]
MSYPVTESDHVEAPKDSSKEFDIKKFLFRMLYFSPWIILSLVISYTIVSLYLRYTPKLHKVSAYVLIKDDEESSPDYDVLRELGVMPGSKEVQNQIDIMQSVSIISGIVDSLNLQIKLFTNAHISASTLYGENRPFYIEIVGKDSLPATTGSYNIFIEGQRFYIEQGGKKMYHHFGDTFALGTYHFVFKRNSKIKSDPDGYLLSLQNRDAVGMALRNSIKVVKMHEMGGIIEIAMLDEVPQRARDIINKLIEAYNTAGVTDKNVVGRKTSSFLTDRVDSVSKELDDLELLSEAYKKNNNVPDIDAAGGTYLTRAQEYDKDRIDELGQLQILNSLEKYIRNAQSNTDIIPANNGLQEPTLGSMIEQYNNAVLAYQQQQKISTEKDPILGRSRNDLNQLKENILKNIANTRSGIDSRLEQANVHKTDFDALLLSLPEKERQLLKLKRQIDVKEKLYLYLLQKKEETEISLVSNINNSRVVDSAYDQGIVLPKSTQAKYFAFFIGLLVPIVILLLKDFFYNKISERSEIEKNTQVPILGEISFSKKLSNVLVPYRSRSIIAEQLRLIRANLQFFSTQNKNQTILVTSFISGEGKSFTAINLANSLAATQSKVLLIDIDLRKPRVNEYLKLNPTYGLTDFLVKNIPIEDMIITYNGETIFDVITSGPVPPNPTELLMRTQMTQLFEYAKTHYDYVIIDSSPVGLVADGFVTGHFADVTLFILRYEYSFLNTIDYIEKMRVENKLVNISIVMNGIKESSRLHYEGYGYGYGYHFGTGYYHDDQKPKNFFQRWFSGK